MIAGCIPGPPHDVAIGTFDGGRLIAIDKWVGTNTTAEPISFDAHADVALQTPGVLELTGTPHWRCTGIFGAPRYGASGIFESDQERQWIRAMNMPEMPEEFAGPAGTYQFAIEIPAVKARFSHSWTLGQFLPAGAYGLIENPATCTPVADSPEGQRAIAGQYLALLQSRIRDEKSSALQGQLQALLDKATLGKTAGDGETDPTQRAVDYGSAADALTAMAQRAPDDFLMIGKLATKAAAVLSESWFEMRLHLS